ncbi:MAG: VanZ family protein, partial [Myroides sp.]
MNNKKMNFFLPLLFIIYITLLIWIIVFKLQFSISELDTVRSINLIPFHYDNEIGVRFHLTEILENIAIFAPLGIYLFMFKH